MTAMFTPIAPPPGLPPAADLISALLDTVDVRPLALDALTQVRSIEWSEGVSTAAIECAVAPRLVLNPDFVQRHCRTPETLAALLLHELAHVTLAHTRLAPRLGAIANIAFDAIINRLVAASLRTRGVEAAPYLRLFEEFYSPTAAPWFLLRPPPGWPDAPDWEASCDAPELLRTLHRRLWTVPSPDPYRDTLPDITARELIAALQNTRDRWDRTGGDESDADADHGASADTAPDASSSGVGTRARGTPRGDAQARDEALLSRLLGNHGASEAESELLVPELQARLRESALARAMPRPALLDGLDGGTGCGVGTGELTARTLAELAGRRETVRALGRAFARAIERGGAHRGRVTGALPVLSPIADQDRRAWGHRRLAAHYGAPAPQLFVRSVAATVSSPVRVAVYLDVSGSMWTILPPLHDVLRRLRSQADVHVWQWSDRVTAAPRGWWRGRVIASSGGTNIDCVREHAVAQARRTRRIVIVTDGEFDRPAPQLLAAAKAARVAMHVAVVGFDGAPTLEHRWGTSYTPVPAWSGRC